ncbi:BEN domain-containing protein 5-like isoform X2 [Ornithodoros turicata]|uniref:BEN domain-containing protein 5-like isoform X2 n=1 Tax=Ornithodoros turicata TaxID=34597 RepID=UPI0031394DCE
MFLLIQYEDEQNKHVVTHDAIVNFDPVDIDDFDKRKLYDAYWEGDDSTCPGFYKAYILHMTETEEEMSTLQKNRCKAPQKPRSAVDVQVRKKAKIDKQARSHAKRSAEAHMLCSAGLENRPSKQNKVQELEKEVQRLQGEVATLTDLNRKLQKALCSKIFEAEAVENSKKGCISPARLQPYTTTPHPVAQMSPPCEQECRTAVVQSAPISLVGASNAMTVPDASHDRHNATATLPAPASSSNSSPAVITMDGVSQSVRSATEVQPAPAPHVISVPSVTTGARDQQTSIRPTKGLFVPQERFQPTTTEDGQVQLGEGIFVSSDTWTHLMQQPADAAFCKRLAVALWGNETLAQCSVTGKQSNKDVSKGKTAVYPQLSPVKVTCMSSAFWHYLLSKGCSTEEAPKRHKQLVRYLAQKCADLRR